MVRFLRMCLDWRVLVTLAVTGILLWIAAPDFVVRALPLLLLAACPISMLFMMRGMQQGQAHHTRADPKGGPNPSGQDANTTVEELKARIKALEGDISRRKAGSGALGTSNERHKEH